MSEWRVWIQRDLGLFWWWHVANQESTRSLGYGTTFTEARARKLARRAILKDKGTPPPPDPPEVWTDEHMDPSDRRTAL